MKQYCATMWLKVFLIKDLSTPLAANTDLGYLPIQK